MPVIYSNNASTTLSSGINNSTTTVPIASASGFPSIGSGEYYFATIANTNNTKIEVVKVTAGTTSLTVTRAQDGTSAQAFDSGDNFQLRVTSATLEAATKTDVNITAGAIAGAAISNDAIDSQHYVDGSIDTAHIADLQVTTAKIAADAITGAKIADDAIDSEHYVDGSIDTAHLASVAVTGAKIANDTINSEHYADASIDAAHLSNDCIDSGNKIADDVINSEHIAAGAIDLEHMSSQSVDEDNLYISNAGSNGQFLSKQSGNNGGLTWADAGGAIPSGTVMAFFQSGAPTGWTKVTSQNDKMLRVVSGTGGGTGGSAAVSSPAHNLSAGSHTLSTSEMPSHNHGTVATGGSTSGDRFVHNNTNGHSTINSVSTGGMSNAGGGGGHSHNMSGSITTPQYIDVILCSYD